jgi:hypothetical protein
VPDDDTTNVVQLKPPAAKRRGNKKGRQPAGAIGPISGAKEITAQQKEARAIELRLRQYTLQQIADELGWETPSAAYKAIMRGLAAEYPEAQRDQLRRMEIARLDDVERITWPDALAGDDRARNTILKCIAQRSKLNGLEAPQQVTLSTREGEPVEVNVTHSLDPAFVAAAELVRSRIVQQSIERAGDVVDVTPTDTV